MFYRIRPANSSDSAGAAAVVRAVYDEYGFAWDEGGYVSDLLDLQTFYLDKGHAFWVAELEQDRSGLPRGTIVGTAAVEVFPKIPGEVGELFGPEDHLEAAGADCSLERLYVLPEARGIGLGTALLAVTIGKALELGRTTMEIWSDKKLTMAHALYEKFGAIRVGERLCPNDPDLSPEWGMVLPLSSELVEKLKSAQRTSVG